MFCLKLKELRNLNSVKLALQALPTPPPKARDFARQKRVLKRGGGKKRKRNKMLKVGFSCPLAILITLGLVLGAI